MTLQELLQARAALVDQQAAMVAAAKAANRTLTAEEDAQFEVLETQIVAKDQEIAAVEKHQAREAKVNARVKDLDNPASPLRRPDAQVGHNRAADRPWDEHNRGSQYALGTFLQSVYNAAQPGVESHQWDPRLKWRAAATGMGTATPADGGFLFERTVATELISNGYAESMLAPLCRKVPIGEMSTGLSVNVVDETSRATGSRWGGVQMYWRGEGDTVTASKPKLRRLDLPLESLMGLMYATREMMRDPVQLGAVFNQAFTEEIAWMIDNGIINGTGVGQMYGVLTSSALISITKETNQKATTIVTQNILKMVARMWGRSLKNAVWCYNQSILPQLATMTIDVGTGGVPVFMPANNISGDPFPRLWNLPLLPLEQCAALGTVGDLILFDPKQYVLIEQGDPEFAESVHVRFINAENTFRIMHDLNGRPYWNSAITPANGSDTLSAYIALATRS